jgi:nicotinamide-nucleotide amidase
MTMLFPPDVMTLARAVLDSCRGRGWTLAAAESCTGGLLLGCLTEIAGSSDVVLGGFVTYANRQKEALGVPAALLATHGAVSAEVAAAMATATRAATAADVAVSITGIAGPGGGSAAKPVGLVWFGLATTERTFTQHMIFAGDRSAVRLAAVAEGLRLLQSAARGDLT